MRVEIDRSAINPNEDKAVVTMHCRGMVSGLPDELNPMDDANRTAFAARLDSFWAALQPSMSSLYKVTAYKFYALGANAAELLGPPDKTVNKSMIGSGGTQCVPPQSSISVTFITDQRRQWGRFFLPGFGTSSLSSGYVTASLCDTICAAAQNLTARSGTGACLTVWSRKQWTHHDPQTVQVDNVYDVIRSRRTKITTYRKQQSAG